jgi:hypothetical protein
MSRAPTQTDRFDAPPPPVAQSHPPLPDWLARRLLRPGEEVTWVRGPRSNPWCECLLTHPALFLIALAFGAACCWAARLVAGSWSDVPPPLVLAVAGIVLASVIVLGISAGYFTRLVVTNQRIAILQGYEVCRSWGLDRLPPSLVRYVRRDGAGDRWAVDLDSLQTMLGGASDHFVDAKTILEFGKQLDRITTKRMKEE